MKKMSFTKRAVAFLLAALLFAGSTMTVFAEDGLDLSTDNKIDTTVEYEFLWTEHEVDTNQFVESTDTKYHDDEAAKAAQGSESVQAMNEQATIAKDAAEDAKDAVTELQQEIADLELDEKTTSAQETANTATTDATAAKEAASDAEEIVDALPTDTAANVDIYNNQVASDQTVIDAAEDIDVVEDNNGNILVGQVDDGQGGTKDVTLEDFVGEQATAAVTATNEAKALLGEALAIDTDVVTQEVIDKVNEVIDAADTAKTAADTAQAVYDKAEAQAAEALKIYNLYAMAYGLPLYGETTVTYDDAAKETALANAVANGLTIVDQQNIKADLEDEINTINGTSLDAQKAIVDNATTSLATAESKLAEATTAATTASGLAADAKTLVDGKDTTADTAAGIVNNYYVDPATAALEKTKADIQTKDDEITTLANEKSQAQSDYESAKTAAKNNNVGVSTYETELDNKRKAKNDAESDYNECSSWNFVTKAILKKARDDARKAYNSYNTEEKKAAVIAAEIEKDASVVEAKNRIQQAESGIKTKTSELTALNQKKVTEEAVLTAAENTKNAYLNEIGTAYENDAKEAFKEAVIAELQKNSDKFNQVEYDRDLNDFVNDTFNTWALWSKDIVRDDLRDKYSDEMNLFEEIVDYTWLTQYFKNTEEADKMMDAMQKVYKSELVKYSEKMATAEANWAAMDTEAAKAAVKTEIDNISGVTTTLATVETQVTTANSELATAQETYDAASEALEKIQDSIKNCTFSNIELAAFGERIKAAQGKLNAAKEELELAQAAAASAANYANWGQQLITEQATMLFAKAIVDENGDVVLDENGEKTAQSWYDNDFDLDDLSVKSRDSKYFIDIDKTNTIIVPYTIYRAYVSAMYDNYDYVKDVETNNGKARGKGIATGDTTKSGGNTSSMDIVYWEMDENGGLTGKYFLSTAEMITGTYFVGYTFKHENDGYHIDGLMYDYEAPAPETPPTPPTPPVTPPATPGTPDTTVTIDAPPVALAAAPVAAPAVADAAVLGATRTLATGTDAAVLGATRGTDKAVLGKRRSPSTGDSTDIMMWFMALGLSVAAAAIATMQITDKKKKSAK